MKYDLVTIGDAFEDVFVFPDLKVRADRTLASGKGIVFEFGEKIPLDNVVYEIGGSACNVAIGLVRQGYQTAIVTMLGEDTPKERVLERLSKEDVDISFTNINKKFSSGFSVIFSIDGERTIFVYHGISDYSNLKIKRSLKSRWFFATPMGDNTDAIENRIIAEVSENNSFFAWNPGSKQILKGVLGFRHLLKCTSVIFLNKEEAIKFINLSVMPTKEEAAKKISQLGVKIVVITDGDKGAIAYDGKDFYHQDAITNIQVKESTGAGDAFASGFMGRIIDVDFKKDIEPRVIEEALLWGIKNSTSVIQNIGAQEGLLAKDSLQ